MDVVSTHYGYLVPQAARGGRPHRTFKLRHTVDETADELNAVVDLGGWVENVSVNHRAYGHISAELNIRSRRDAARFIDDIRTGKSAPLMQVTSGYHFHRVSAESEEALDEIEARLEEMGFCVERLPYEEDMR